MSADGHAVISLSGSDLSLATLAEVARDPGVRVVCQAEALERVRRCRQVVDDAVRDYRAAYVRACPDGRTEPKDRGSLPDVYGVTTGFGEFKRIAIHPDQLADLQTKILLSHAAGVGTNLNRDDLANYFPAEIVRATLVMRLNAFLRGNSGVRVELLDYILAMLNRGMVPLVPLRGSVGTSGDLCPLAHLFATLLGHGRYFVVHEPADLTNASPEIRPATAENLRNDLGMELYRPAEKEGLALTNGATFSAATLALAVHDAEMVANVADIAAALTMEAVCGRTRSLDEKVHAARSMCGQLDSAANLRSLLIGSDWLERAEDVQDAYSLRCAPQVHGASRDAVSYARSAAEREMRASTDNPLFFPGERPFDERVCAAKCPSARQTDEQRYPSRDKQAYSAGNFHGQPLALAADFLGIALAELADISERRTQMLLDAAHNRNLPANLVPEAGLNSGFMIAQYCAAGLVSENKVLAHPASVDSIPTSANAEDHVSMATIAARKARDILSHVQSVLAIELMCAAQAVEWRIGVEISPRSDGRAPTDGGRERRGRDQQFRELGQDGPAPQVAGQLGPGTAAAYREIRRLVGRLLNDRVLEDDLYKLRRAIHDRSLINAVNAALECTGGALRPVRRLRFEGETAS